MELYVIRELLLAAVGLLMVVFLMYPHLAQTLVVIAFLLVLGAVVPNPVKFVRRR